MIASSNRRHSMELILLFLCCSVMRINSFLHVSIPTTSSNTKFTTTTTTTAIFSSNSSNSDENDDPTDIIAKRIIVTGPAVQGGYYRSCVLNEAGRFRRLTGTMSPPDDSSTSAEIYVEGKRKVVDGFVRWCQRGNKNVGLNQITIVQTIIDEIPVGIYDDFYVQTL